MKAIQSSMKLCSVSLTGVHGKMTGEVLMKITVLYLIMLLSYGCGAKKMAVENADTLINHQVNKHLPLYSEQRDQLKRDIDKLLDKEKPVAMDILPVIDQIDLKNQD